MLREMFLFIFEKSFLLQLPVFCGVSGDSHYGAELMVSGCSTVVEHIAYGQEVVNSNPVVCWAHFFFILSQ